MGLKVNITGYKFGELTAVRFLGKIKKGRSNYWECMCSCGKTSQVRVSHLIAGDTKSCGCRKPNKTHGMTSSHAYKIWEGMRRRCSNPNDDSYIHYGGRGISIDWNSFEEFYRDMGDPPIGKSIDRIDNNGNYSKNNCRWATQKEQNVNRRNNVVVTLSKTISEWADLLGVSPKAMYVRHKMGWSPEDILFYDYMKKIDLRR